MRHLFLGLAVITIAALPAAAQNVETDPIQCWWRTSAGAVRVGEPFSLVLTCAVVENDRSPADRTAPTCAPTIAGSFSTSTGCG